MSNVCKKNKMSTFGRKALVWWDYEDNSKQNVMRFNHTDLDIQLKILEKWYPIGARCREKEKFTYRTPRPDGGYDWEIIGYSKTVGGWYTLEVKWVNDMSINRESTIIPLRAEINPEDIKRIKREAKLSRLGF